MHVSQFCALQFLGFEKICDPRLGRIAGGIAEATSEDATLSLFALLGTLPFAELTSGLAVVIVVLFFVTSSESGSLVVDMITSGGNIDPPIPQRIFWAVTEGLVAAVLLLTGGLLALQTAASGRSRDVNRQMNR